MGVVRPSLDDPIAKGRTAEVYAWGDDQVLKLFREWVPHQWVDYEARIARTVQATGLPVPQVGEVVEINGRRGLTYERVEGYSMLSEIQAKPWRLPGTGRRLAELQAALHTNLVPKLPSLRERLETKIKSASPLPDELKEAALLALQKQPDGDRLCHGDFHPGNILITRRGPIIIDWVDASCGHPLADVARTSLLLSLGALPPGTPQAWLIETTRAWLLENYLRYYFRLTRQIRQQLRAWMPVVAAARLSEGIVEEREQLLAIARLGLEHHKTAH